MIKFIMPTRPSPGTLYALLYALVCACKLSLRASAPR